MAELISVPGGKVPGTSNPVGVNEIDASLVEEVVRRMNRRHASAQLALCRAFGEILLDAFYGGDLAALGRIGRQHASLRAVLNHPELRPSGTQAWYALHLLPQLRALGDAVADAIPLSHHRILMHVHDPDAKLALAVRAASEDLSKRALAEEVDRWLQSSEQRGKPRLGRPRSPRAVSRAAARPEVRVERTPEPANGAHPSSVYDQPAEPVTAPTVADTLETLVAELQRIVAFARSIPLTVESLRHVDRARVAQAIEEGERAIDALEEFFDDVRLAIEAQRPVKDA